LSTTRSDRRGRRRLVIPVRKRPESEACDGQPATCSLSACGAVRSSAGWVSRCFWTLLRIRLSRLSRTIGYRRLVSTVLETHMWAWAGLWGCSSIMARGKTPFKVSWRKIRDRTSVSQGILLIPTVKSLNDPTRADHPVATNRVVLGLSVAFLIVVTVVRLLTKLFSGEKKRMGQETGNHP